MASDPATANSQSQCGVNSKGEHSWQGKAIGFKKLLSAKILGQRWAVARSAHSGLSLRRWLHVVGERKAVLQMGQLRKGAHIPVSSCASGLSATGQNQEQQPPPGLCRK